MYNWPAAAGETGHVHVLTTSGPELTKKIRTPSRASTRTCNIESISGALKVSAEPLRTSVHVLHARTAADPGVII